MAKDLSAGEIIAVVYHLLFTVFACAVMVEFFRRRHDYYLKARIPALSLAQMINCVIECVLVGVALPFTTGKNARCYMITVWDGVFAGSLVFMHVLRAWNLYWQLFLTKHLARSRDHIREQIEKRPSISMSSNKSVTIVHTRVELLKYRVVRYAIVGYFTVLVFAFIFFIHYEFITTGCWIGPVATDILLVMMASTLVAAVFLLVSVGKFKDRYKIFLEIRYTVAAYCFFLPIAIGLVVNASYATGSNGKSWVILISLLPIFGQVFFVICALPLMDQRSLDRKVKECEFDGLDTFEDVLAQPAALVALEHFMRLEFTEELLEFYDIVTEFKERHDTWTPEKRLRVARVIYAQFVAPGAPSQINLSDLLLRGIRLHMFGPSGDSADRKKIQDVPNNAFDAAQAEMAKLIRSGPLLRFQLHRVHGDLPPIDPAAVRRTRRYSRSNGGTVSRKSISCKSGNGFGLGTLGHRASAQIHFDSSLTKPSAGGSSPHAV